jgi:hypothetical protein
VYGTDQNSGNSPDVRTMLSSVLSQMLNMEAQVAQYWPHNNKIFKMVSTAYVDNVNTHHTTNIVNPGGLISASGGKVAPEKCNPREQDDIDHKFMASKILLSDYHKSLGHRMSPKDPNKAQINHMKDIQNQFVGDLNHSNLTWKEHAMMYRNIYTPTKRYIVRIIHKHTSP